MVERINEADKNTDLSVQEKAVPSEVNKRRFHINLDGLFKLKKKNTEWNIFSVYPPECFGKGEIYVRSHKTALPENHNAFPISRPHFNIDENGRVIQRFVGKDDVADISVNEYLARYYLYTILRGAKSTKEFSYKHRRGLLTLFAIGSGIYIVNKINGWAIAQAIHQVVDAYEDENEKRHLESTAVASQKVAEKVKAAQQAQSLHAQQTVQAQQESIAATRRVDDGYATATQAQKNINATATQTAIERQIKESETQKEITKSIIKSSAKVFLEDNAGKLHERGYAFLSSVKMPNGDDRFVWISNTDSINPDRPEDYGGDNRKIKRIQFKLFANPGNDEFSIGYEWGSEIFFANFGAFQSAAVLPVGTEVPKPFEALPLKKKLLDGGEYHGDVLYISPDGNSKTPDSIQTWSLPTPWVVSNDRHPDKWFPFVPKYSGNKENVAGIPVIGVNNELEWGPIGTLAYNVVNDIKEYKEFPTPEGHTVNPLNFLVPNGNAYDAIVAIINSYDAAKENDTKSSSNYNSPDSRFARYLNYLVHGGKM